mgnify:CR=1 FL=1
MKSDVVGDKVDLIVRWVVGYRFRSVQHSPSRFSDASLQLVDIILDSSKCYVSLIIVGQVRKT